MMAKNLCSLRWASRVLRAFAVGGLVLMVLLKLLQDSHEPRSAQCSLSADISCRARFGRLTTCATSGRHLAQTLPGASGHHRVEGRCQMRSSVRESNEKGHPAVVLVDHGSRKKESNDMLLSFAELYKEVSQRDIVEIAHMEIAEPTVIQAIEKCQARGASSIIVAPYFLSNGRHVQIDIPEIIEDARAKFPSLDIKLAKPLGMDRMIAEIIEARVSSCENSETVPVF